MPSAHALLDMLPEVVMVLDRESIIHWVNKRVVSRLGYSPDELVGQSIQLLIPRSVYPTLNHTALTLDYQQGCPSRIVGHTGRLVTVQRKDGSLVDMKLAVTMQGEQFCGTLTTVEGSGGGGDQMLSLVSHETRNFLMVARANLESIAVQLPVSEAVPPDASGGTARACPAVLRVNRQSLTRALDAIDSSTSVLRDLGTLSHVASNTLQCDRSWMKTTELIDRLRTHAASIAAKSTVPMQLNCTGNASTHVAVEIIPQHLEQLVMNLVTNAMTRAATSIVVNLQLVIPADDESFDDNMLVSTVKFSVAVEDDGPTISRVDRPYVFQQYELQRRNNAKSGLMPSSLGLHLCQIFASEHDGTAAVGNAENVAGGTRFSADMELMYRLEYSRTNVRSTSTASDSKFAAESFRCSVLVIDDLLLIRRLVEKFVQRCLPLAVVVGASTVAEARALLAERSFDVIVTDYQLPDGTGADVVAGVTGPIIICISGSNPPPGAFHHVLPKPVAFKDLRMLLFRLIDEN